MFDARGSTSQDVSIRQMVIAIGAMVAVASAFALALYWPTPQEHAASKAANYQMNLVEADRNVLKIAMPDLKAKKLESAFMELDASAYQHLESKLKSSRNERQAAEITMTELSNTLKKNKALLSRIPVHHIDDMLNLTRKGLRSASRKNSLLCDGSLYADLNTRSPSQRSIKALSDTFVEGSTQFAIDMAALLMEAASDARYSGTQHGKVSRVDNAAIQGVVLSLLGDKQIRELIVQSKVSQSPEDVMANVDVCSLGVSVLDALATLPQDTKGRIWAAMIKGDAGAFEGIGFN